MCFRPKIYKRLFHVPGRPVISNCGTSAEKASEFLDIRLKTIMQESWSYIKHSADFINKIGQIGDIPENAISVIADVVGLYPGIPPKAGLKALKNAMEKREQKHILTEKLINTADFVFKNNFFEFNVSVKQQVSGTTIGTKCAPTYACICMDEVETEFLKTQERTPLVWFRYIDVFHLHLETFLQELNNLNPDLKITYESNEKEIPFLDLKVKLNENKISTDLYIKSTERHQYLHFTSAHPNHTKRSIVYSLELRVKRLCSEKQDFLKHMREIKLWFLKRGYPENIVDQELGKREFSESSRRTNKRDKGVCLVATYHPLLQNIGRIFHRHLDLLYTDQEVERVFTPRPMASFRSARKIGSYLVRAKLYPLERRVGSFKCGGRRCQVYLNITETETFTGTSTNQTYKINHEFNCNESSLIYLLTCKICRKQCVGQIVDIFHSRCNRSNDIKYLVGEPCMQEHIFKHFNSEGHTGFLQNVSGTFIDKTDSQNPEKIENYWIQTLKTMVLRGLNILNSV